MQKSKKLIIAAIVIVVFLFILILGLKYYPTDNIDSSLNSSVNSSVNINNSKVIINNSDNVVVLQTTEKKSSGWVYFFILLFVVIIIVFIYYYSRRITSEEKIEPLDMDVVMKQIINNLKHEFMIEDKANSYIRLIPNRDYDELKATNHHYFALEFEVFDGVEHYYVVCSGLNTKGIQQIKGRRYKQRINKKLSNYKGVRRGELTVSSSKSDEMKKFQMVSKIDPDLAKNESENQQTDLLRDIVNEIRSEDKKEPVEQDQTRPGGE